MVQHSLFEARQARDEGIEKVRSKNSEWLERALEWLPGMKAEGHESVTGEGIRIWMHGRGLPDPTNAHAWGMLVRTAVKRGLLVDTGRQTQMFTKKSHARRTPLWKVM